MTLLSAMQRVAINSRTNAGGKYGRVVAFFDARLDIFFLYYYLRLRLSAR